MQTRARGSPAAPVTSVGRLVAKQLAAAGYQVTSQPFEFAFFQRTADPSVHAASRREVYAYGIEQFTMDYSGSGSSPPPYRRWTCCLPPTGGSTSGCEAADFAGFFAGNIALIQRGTCTFE